MKTLNLTLALAEKPPVTGITAPRSRFPGWTLVYERRAGESHVYGDLDVLMNI